ncbi:hypothetical protein [Rufibacter sp. LB8]|uniref:hypothetical protein n=1 Tax=Rufibacter sp. LB8 TaxID=2777781 RepID=UPI00178C6959|nr:hypothetical protein [Rufibacter sp. LB8]
MKQAYLLFAESNAPDWRRCLVSALIREYAALLCYLGRFVQILFSRAALRFLDCTLYMAKSFKKALKPKSFKPKTIIRQVVICQANPPLLGTYSAHIGSSSVFRLISGNEPENGK